MLDTMVGKEFEFYGVDSNEFKLDDTVYEAIEDESDGYRSYLESIVVKKSGGIFFHRPVALVRVEELNGYHEKCYGDFKGWQLVDIEDGHVWLIVGTENYDDYYPGFAFKYFPKTTQMVDW